MRAQLDWISFTVPVSTSYFGENDYGLAIEIFLKTYLGEDLANRIFQHEWREMPHSRAPYNRAWQIPASGCVVFTHDALPHLLCEFSGTGCDYLRAAGLENILLRQIVETITRLDIAIDIITDVKPATFVASAKTPRTRRITTDVSDTGETIYLGSKSSERYCRVYRYKEPHPRAGALRIEEVFRRKYARHIASQILDKDTLSVARALGESRGWAHPCWGVSASDSAHVSLPRPEREGKSTVMWLIKQCAPAFRRCVADGQIADGEAFLLKHFLAEAQAKS